jgi:hypothetical protein
MKKLLFSVFALIFSTCLLSAQLAPTNPPPSVVCSWSASPDPNVINYFVYYGSESGFYTNKVSASTNLTLLINTGLVRGSTYYFAATSLSSNGLESNFSNEVFISVPNLPLPPQGLEVFAYDPFSAAVYGVANKNELYAIERTSDFDNWLVIGNTSSSDNGFFYLIDNDPPIDQGFYRIKL